MVTCSLLLSFCIVSLFGSSIVTVQSTIRFIEHENGCMQKMTIVLLLCISFIYYLPQVVEGYIFAFSIRMETLDRRVLKPHRHYSLKERSYYEQLQNFSQLFPEVTSLQWNQFEQLCKLLIDWNEKVNLISRKEIHHFDVYCEGRTVSSSRKAGH